DFVDLVEHEDGIAGLRAAERLDDATGHGSDVRPPMPADLRLVTDASQRHPRELPPQRAGDALAEAGLAHPGRTYEAEDGLARRAVSRHARRRGRCGAIETGGALFAELLHREVLEDAVLDLLEVVVIFVEDLPRPGHVDGAARQLVPGQGRHPVEVRDDHAVLGRGGGGATETPQLAVRLAARLLRRPRLLEAPAPLRHLGVALLLLAELALDGPELLTEIVLALLLAQALLGLRGDLPAELAHSELALEEIHEAAELVAHRIHLEDLLARRRVQGHHR